MAMREGQFPLQGLELESGECVGIALLHFEDVLIIFGTSIQRPFFKKKV